MYEDPLTAAAYLYTPVILFIVSGAIFAYGTFKRFPYNKTVAMAVFILASIIFFLPWMERSFECRVTLTYIIVLKGVILYLVYRWER